MGGWRPGRGDGTPARDIGRGGAATPVRVSSGEFRVIGGLAVATGLDMAGAGLAGPLGQPECGQRGRFPTDSDRRLIANAD